MNRINSISKNKGIFVVEDVAQAMGGSYQGKKLGTLGDVGFFSLGRGKNITCGSGGIIITNSDEIAAEVEKQIIPIPEPTAMESLFSFFTVLIMNIFLRPSLYWFPSGLSFLKLGETIFHKNFPVKKLSGMQAGLMHNWKRRLEESNSIRRLNAELFCNMTGLQKRDDLSVSLLRLPLMASDRGARSTLYSLSREKGMGISCMYPTSVNNIREIEDLFSGKAFPNASEIAERIFTVPTHELLSKKDKKTIIQFLRNIALSADEEFDQIKRVSRTITGDQQF
jgi:dTDP-4-amino-4,6-dideoxygalactose transaminase